MYEYTEAIEQIFLENPIFSSIFRCVVRSGERRNGIKCSAPAIHTLEFYLGSLGDSFPISPSLTGTNKYTTFYRDFFFLILKALGNNFINSTWKYQAIKFCLDRIIPVASFQAM